MSRTLPALIALAAAPAALVFFVTYLSLQSLTGFFLPDPFMLALVVSPGIVAAMLLYCASRLPIGTWYLFFVAVLFVGLMAEGIGGAFWFKFFVPLHERYGEPNVTWLLLPFSTLSVVVVLLVPWILLRTGQRLLPRSAQG